MVGQIARGNTNSEMIIPVTQTLDDSGATPGAVRHPAATSQTICWFGSDKGKVF